MNRCLSLWLLSLPVMGCQPAAQFTPPSPAGTQPEQRAAAPREEPLPHDLDWDENPYAELPRAVPLVFVSEAGNRTAWEKLPKYWNASPLSEAGPAVTLITLPPWGAVALASAAGQPISVKVPRGLPTLTYPEGNPPTLPKWQLGRDLFFDKTYLHGDKKAESCADCHIPERGYTDHFPTHNGYNTPTLINVAYNRHQFWDGRVTHLEEVVQRSLSDERETELAERSGHSWSGVVRRLRDNPRLRRRFADVFGTGPTRDTVGRALATYLRTILAADSLFDRAVEAQRLRGVKELETADFVSVLTDADLVTLDRKGADKKYVARDLMHGYQVFNDPKRKASCAACHPAPLFTDGKFHNLGVGFSYDRSDPEWPATLGHFAHAPLGEKRRELIGAFKTPTLRGLLRSGPYLHTGEEKTLEGAIRAHGRIPGREGQLNRYLDPLLVEGPGNRRMRELDLNDEEVNDLVLFLRALNGAPVDASVTTPPVAPK